MLIGIDASRAVRARRTGTENYSLQLIRHLVALGSVHRFRLYYDRKPPAGLLPGDPHAEVRAMPFPRLWTHLRLSWEVSWHRPDVLFVPAHVLPLLHPANSVVTIHDLGYLHHPEAHPPGQRAYLEQSTRWNARRSAHLVVDSEATRKDVTAFYGVPAGRMTVVYPGRDETLHPVRDEAELAGVRARYGLGERYILHVGTLQPRKNLVRLVDAFSELGDSGVQLVLAGKRGWLAEPVFQRVKELGLGDAVRFPGYVEDSDLPALLSGAACFAFPSLHEGFGFPVLEAQACGTPVVASSLSSVPEVAGEAALFVDPSDSGALAQALARILHDEPLRTALIEKGFANLQRFSWQRCAEQVLAVLERVGGGG